MALVSRWTTSNIPSQVGRTAIVTGAGGLGFECALALARAGATVIVAGRNQAKGGEAVSHIGQLVPQALVRFELLDLARLRSIADFASRLSDRHPCVDILLNNAGVMAPPARRLTSDGFELQFGTNFLGHFALTAHLLALLRKATHPRVVNVSSIAAHNGAIHFDDLQAERRYAPMAAYSQSKLANLLFSFELQRRNDTGRWGMSSVAAHPGVSRTELIRNGSGWFSRVGVASVLLGPVLFQSAAQGALPLLYAATSPEAKAGGYYGPDGFREIRGFPTVARIPLRASDADVAWRLWQVAERLAGVSWPAS